MKKIYFLLAIIMFYINIYSQNSNYTDGPYFAISLQPSTQDIITFAIVDFNSKGEVTKRIFLKRTDWIRQIIGIQQSIANSEGKNILKEAGLESPDVIEELWKLRYAEWPYHGSKDKGWAGKPRMPSEGQMLMLKKFGLNSLSDYIFGNNLIKLLQSMNDPAWVSEYQSK